MSKLRKIFTVSVMFVTVLSMSVVVAPSASAAVAQAGDLIKMDGLQTVYYLGNDSKRYVFPNETTFKSWYSDFSGVVTVSQTELQGYQLGKVVTMRAGTKLVKITTDPKVYAVAPGGELKWIGSEDAAKTLYGDDWATRVIDVPDQFISNYKVNGVGYGDASASDITATEVTGSTYPDGTLIKYADSSDIYLIEGGSKRMITNEAALIANRYKFADVIEDVPATFTFGTGTAISAMDADLTNTSASSGGVATIPGGSGLTVALASDTQAASNIPAGSPNPFVKLNLTAASDGAVKVNSIKLTSYQLGTPTYIDSVTFYDEGVKVGTSKNMNSDREATFNFSTPIDVAAGTTKTLLIKATIESTKTGNFALGIAAASDIDTVSSAVINGSFPMQGNTMASVSGVTIGTVTMSSILNTTTDTTNNFGEDNVLLGGFNLTVANEAVLAESIRFINGGTNVEGIVSNIKLLIDGDEVVTGVEMNGKYVDFDLDNYLISKNDSVALEIYGDLGIASVGNTIKLYIDDANDLVFIGQSFGYGIQVASIGDLNAASDALAVTLAAGDVTLDMDKSATPSKDVRPGDNDVILATFSILSNGENATITAIGDGTDVFYIAGASDGSMAVEEIDNVELRDITTGAVYDVAIASSTDTDARIALTLSDEVSLVQGVTKTFQLRVDLQGPNDTDGIDANDTLQVVLEDGAFSITGDDSNDDLSNDMTPVSITSAIATVKTASLTWSTTSLTDKTVVGGAENVVVYRAAVEAGESSAITLTSVKLSGTGTSVNGFTDTNIAELRLYVDGKLTKTVGGGITEGTGSVTPEINFTSLHSTNRVIPAGAGVEIEVQADFASSFTAADSFRLQITDPASSIVSRDADNTLVAEGVGNVDSISRLITMATVGTLKVELKTDDPKANNDTFILAGTSTRADNYLGEIVLTTANEAIKIKTLVLEQQGSSTGSDIAAVHLYDKDGAIIATKVPSTAGHVNFDSLNIVVPADQATSWFIGITTKTINAEGDAAGTATYGHEAIYSFASTTGLAIWSLAADKAITASGNESGSDIALVNSNAQTAAAGNYPASTTITKIATTTGSRLTSITNAMANGTLSGGNNKVIGKYKFVFDNGTNRDSSNVDMKARLTTLVLTMASSTTTYVNNVQAYIEGNSSDLTDVVEIDTSHNATIILTDLDDSNEDVDGEITLVIIGDVVTSGTSQYVQTSIADLTGDFTYNGNSGTTAMNWNDQSADLSVSYVDGATLSN